MEKLKSFLRKWPLFYRFMQNVYGKVKIFVEYVTRTNIDEKEERRWSNRHLLEGDDWAIEKYWEARNHPGTQFLVEKIASYSPFSSILEVGSNCGPNLYLLAKKFPKVNIEGIDINPMAVQKGNELFAKEGISNVKLSLSKADNLSKFPDKSFDIVFAKAVLCHIGPSKVSGVIKEMARVSKNVMILVDYHDPSETDESSILGTRIGHSWRWKRNWVALLKKLVPQAKIALIKIPEEVWEGDWGKMGYIIKFCLQK